MATSIQILDVEILTDLSVEEESVIQGGHDRHNGDKGKDKDYGNEKEEKDKKEERKYNYYWEGFDKYSWFTKKDD